MRGPVALYAASPAPHRVLPLEGPRGVKAERVHAFDVRVVAVMRHFLAATGASVRRDNLEAAGVVAYQAVRAAMPAYLRERPPGLAAASLEREPVDPALRYPVDDARPEATGAGAPARLGAGAPRPRGRRRAAGPGSACPATPGGERPARAAAGGRRRVTPGARGRGQRRRGRRAGGRGGAGRPPLR